MSSALELRGKSMLEREIERLVKRVVVIIYWDFATREIE